MKKRSSRVFLALRYIIPILITVGWICFIFSNSLQNGEESGNQSHAVTEVINGVTESLGIEQPISESFIRTSAHFGEFAVLGLLLSADLLCLGFVFEKNRLGYRILYFSSLIPICFSVALLDEFIQKFSDGRAAQWEDVGIDTLGGFVSILTFAVIFIISCAIAKNIKKNKAQN